MYIIHYSSDKNNIGYVWRGIKANFYRAAPPSPRFEIPETTPELIALEKAYNKIMHNTM